MRFVDFVTQALRVPLTPAQRVLAVVGFDGVEPEQLDGEERALARQLFGDIDTIPPGARAVLALVLGARSGKSYVFVALYCLWRALFADLSTLAPGERAVALIVSVDQRLGRQSLRYALGAAKREPHLRRMLDSETADGFILRRPDGREVSIEVLPAGRGGSALRGRSLVCACLDECAFFRDESFVVNDAELFKAVAPRVLPGGLVVLASTPWLEQGLFYELFAANFGHPKGALVAHGPTLLLLNTARNIDVVEREQERDLDNALREFGAEFVAGGSSLVFPPDLLREVFVGDELPSKGPAVRVVLGGDIGLVSDSSAFVPVFVRGNLLSVGAELELRPQRGTPLKLSHVVSEAAALAEKLGTTTIHLDHHVLEPAREHAPAGLRLSPVPGGQAAKAERFTRAAQLMKEGRLIAPRMALRLKAQLADVQSRLVPGGGVQILQPRRGAAHGDVAAAAVLAIWAAARPHLSFTLTRREREPHELDGWLTRESARKVTGY